MRGIRPSVRMQRQGEGMASDTQHLPERTVTVLSSDLVGSTQLNQQLGTRLELLWNRDLFQDLITSAVAD